MAAINTLRGDGIATTLNHNIQYVARLTNNAFGPNGNSWLVTTVPYISFGTVMEDDQSREIFMVESQRLTTRFAWDSSGQKYLGKYGTRRQVKSTPEGYLVSGPSGANWLFFGPSAISGLRGKLKRMKGADGVETVATYDSAQRLVSLVRTLPNSFDSASLHYVSANSGAHAGKYLSVEKRIYRDGISIPVKRWRYSYHPGSDEAGNVNDLKTASEETFNIHTGEWDHIGTSYYRYYKENSAIGFQYGLRFSVKPQDYARMVRDGYPPENISVSNDAVIAQYATSHRKYDEEKRVIEVQVMGGSQTTLYDRLNGETGTVNWNRRSVITRPDGSVETVYFNVTNQPILKILSKNSVQWMEFSVYNEFYLPILRCGADAIDSVSLPASASENLVVNLKMDSGLIRRWEYYPALDGGPGSAPSYLKSEGIQNGSGGQITKIYELTYVAQATGDDVLYRIASKVEFRSEAGGGSQPVVTSYAYQWHVGGARPLQRITTLPVVSIAEHGTGQTHVFTERYDQFGNLQWVKNAAGFLTYQVYDPLTGAAIQRVNDVDVKKMSSLVVPPTWVTPSGGGLHLISDYSSDPQGRVTQSVGPVHSCDLHGVATMIRRVSYKVYLDARRQDWSAAGYVVGDGFRTIGPVNITQRDFRGQITDEISASHSEDDKIDGLDSFPQSSWSKWTRYIYSDEGLLLGTCSYASIPISDREVDENPVLGVQNDHYNLVKYGYDTMNRLNRTLSASGTITRDVIDFRGLFLERWLGTDDSGATDSDPSGGAAPGNNMVPTIKNTYDSGTLDSLGRLIQERRLVNENPGDDRVNDYQYDDRGRLARVTEHNGSNTQILVQSYDNIDNLVAKTGYTNSVLASNRRSYTSIAVDALGRVYLEQFFGVNSDGSLANPLKRSRWYDSRSNQIKTVSPGSKTYVKYKFDSINRLIVTYVAYPQSGGLDGNSNNVTNDIVIEQNATVYDSANNVLYTENFQRFHDASGTGALLGPNGNQPRARVTYTAQWADPIGRNQATANFGTLGGREFERPLISPVSTDTILVTRIAYAQRGQPSQAISPDGNITRWWSDCLGRKIKVVENFVEDAEAAHASANRTSEISYSSEGEVSRLIVSNVATGDQVTSWEYGVDDNGSGVVRTDLLRSKVYPGGRDQLNNAISFISYRYNRQSEIIGYTDANGTDHDLVLDKSGRIIEDRVISIGPGIDSTVRRISLSYNSYGLMSRVRSYSSPIVGQGSILNEVALVYNAYRQISEDIQSHSGATSSSTPRVRYTYDDGSTNQVRRKSIEYPSGHEVLVKYGLENGIDDRLARLSGTQISGESTQLAAFKWAGLARFLELEMEQPNLVLSYIKPVDAPAGDSGDPYSGYDRFGRTVEMRWKRSASGDLLNGIQYGYDRSSRRKWRQELAAPVTDPQDKFFEYDGIGQLLSLSEGTLNINRSSIAGIPVFEENFQYDPTGNWHKYKTSNRDEAEFVQRRSYNQNNQIESIDEIASGISYDKVGNMQHYGQAISQDQSSGYLLVWDAWNRLTRIRNSRNSNEIVRYSYDGLSARISSTSNNTVRHFYYDLSWKVLEERINSSNTPDTLYFWSLRPGHRDELLRRDRDTNGNGSLDESVYCLSDYYDTVSTVDTSGNILERYSYSSFGKTRFLNSNFQEKISSNIEWNVLFHGQMKDAYTGFYNYGFRYFSVDLGRWLSRDPIAEDAGNNMYRMTGNDTINQHDFLGLEPGCCPPGTNNVQARGTGEWCCNVDLVNVTLEDGSTVETCFGNPPEGRERSKDSGGGGGGGGGGVISIRKNYDQGDGINCRDKDGAARCLLDVGINAFIGLAPVLGNLLGLTGVEINLFQRGDWSMAVNPGVFGGGAPGVGNAAGGFGSAGELYNADYNAAGGDAEHARLRGYVDNGRAGRGMRSGFATLSGLRRFARSLPVIGNVLGIVDAAQKAKDCYDKFCK